MNTFSTVSRWGLAALGVGMAVGAVQLARAGWTGGVNGSGFGTVKVSVSTTKGTIVTNTASWTGSYPSAAIPQTAGYSGYAARPVGASSSTYARIKADPSRLYSFTFTQTATANGDKADAPAITDRVLITPGDCATLSMETIGDLSPDGQGTITVDAIATAGAAILLRGYEWQGQGLPQTIEELTGNSIVKFEILLQGPFNLQQANCNAVVIPFTTTDKDRMFFVVDGVAESTPFTMTCPEDVVFGCEECAPEYSAVQTSWGCC
jgi:hypothetical protein